jgi:hypothetical protein
VEKATASIGPDGVKIFDFGQTGTGVPYMVFDLSDLAKVWQ